MKTADEIIQEIAEVLGQSDGQFIERIANQILTTNVKYVGDSMFETDDDLSEEERVVDDMDIDAFNAHPDNWDINHS